MAVCDVMAVCRSSMVGATMSLAPVRRMAAVPDAAAAHDDDLSLHAGGVGELVDIFGVGAGDAARGGAGDGAGRAGGDHAGFGAGHLGEMSADGACSSNRSMKKWEASSAALRDLRKLELRR